MNLWIKKKADIAAKELDEILKEIEILLNSLQVVDDEDALSDPFKNEIEECFWRVHLLGCEIEEIKKNQRKQTCFIWMLVCDVALLGTIVFLMCMGVI